MVHTEPDRLASLTTTGAAVPTRLVIPLDGTDFAARAVPVACRFAVAFGAQVVAITTPQSLDGARDTPAWMADLAARSWPAPMRTVVAHAGDPVTAVADQVAEAPGAAVCMATHARGAIGSLALGNVAQDVLRRAGVPVLLVGHHCEVDVDRHGPIVVAHDGSLAADAVVGAARVWADACGVPVVLVHVYHPLDRETPSHPEAALVAAADELGPGTRMEVVAGSFPAGTIRDVAHELDASAIAVSTHGCTAAAEVAMGRVASWVTRESASPVLTVRPSTFAS
jgi:nucleotide-binding universal stress UspA family protein